MVAFLGRIGHWSLRVAALGAVALAALAGPLPGLAPALAQDYPTKTVTLVVPYPPGGGVDVLARVVAERLSSVIGQQVIVDNRVGGSGLVGTRATIRSAPDGYTLFFGHTGSISINPVPLRQCRLRSAQGLHRRSACSPRCRSRCSRIPRSRPRPSARWSRSPRRRAASSTSAPRRSAPAAISPPSCSSRSPASRRPSCPTRARRS